MNDERFEPNLRAIGNGIRAQRERVGMKQKDLAELTGVSAAHINDVEHGRRAVTRQMAIEIAAHIDWSHEWIDLMMGRLPSLLLKDSYTDADIVAIREALGHRSGVAS